MSIENPNNEQREKTVEELYTDPDDLEMFQNIQGELEKLEQKRDALDREILEIEFDIGLRELEKLASDENTNWILAKNSENIHEPNLPIEFKTWKTVTQKTKATISMVKEPTGPSFLEGLERFAEEIGDLETVHNMRKWPKIAERPYRAINFSFKIEPRQGLRGYLKTILESGAEGCLGVDKTFGFIKEDDSYKAGVYGSRYVAQAFPRISPEKQARAITLMRNFAYKVGVEEF